MSTEKEEQVTPTNPLSSREPGFESRVFGRWGSVVRYLWGTICVFAMCYIAYLDAITTRISVEKYGKWPSEWHFLIMTVGISICAMSFANANKTISTILSTGGLKETAKAMVMAKFSPNGTPIVAAKAPEVIECHWWNPEGKQFVTILDNSIDMTQVGFIRVPSARPDTVSVWDETTQRWMSPSN